MVLPATSEPLLPRVAAGEPEAVRACLDRYGSLVWSVVRKLTRDQDAAEDVVQEVFIDLWRSAARYDPERASEATFVATIARRKAIDAGRRRSRRPVQETLAGIDPGGVDEGLGHVDVRDEAARATHAMQSLRPEQRRVLLLSIRDGLSHSQIAKATQLPLGTVKSHVRRGLERVSRLLASEGPGRAEASS